MVSCGVKRAVSVILGTVCAIHLRAAESTKPPGFMGVPWRATQSEVVKILGVDRCWNGTTDSWCEANLELSQWVIATARFYFDGGRFGEVVVTFNTRDFDFVRQVFINRYGEPAARKVSEVRTKMNVPYSNEMLFWKWSGGISALLAQFTGTTEEGSFSISTAWYTEARTLKNLQDARSATRSLDEPPKRQSPEPQDEPTTEASLYKELGLSTGMTIDQVEAKIGKPQGSETGWYSGVQGEKWLYRDFGYALIFASSDKTLRGIEALRSDRSPPAKGR